MPFSIFFLFLQSERERENIALVRKSIPAGEAQFDHRLFDTNKGMEEQLLYCFTFYCSIALSFKNIV
jgi:hypothetical protein